MITALLLAAASAWAAAQPASLKSADRLYLRRDRPGDLERSTAELEALAKSSPDSYDVLWRLGRNHLAAGERQPSKDAKLQAYAEAAQDLRRAVKLKPDDAQAHYWLAAELAQENSIRRTLGLARSMKAELETATSLDAKHADAHQLLCELLRQLPRLFGGDKERAVRECEEALRLTPNETARYPALAQAYLAVGRREDAVAVLKRAFAVAAPADPGSAAGDLRDARDLLKKLTGSSEPGPAAGPKAGAKSRR